MSHTPGPWIVDETTDSNGFSYYILNGPNVVVMPENPEGSIDAAAESRANARLIAAAPDMLDALIKLANEAAGFLSLSDVERHGMTNSRILRDRIEQARDIIQKVRQIMKEQQNLTVREESALAPNAINALITKILDGPVPLEKVEVLERIMAMQERAQAQDRKQQFIEAMNGLQAVLPQITKMKPQLNKPVGNEPATVRNYYAPIEDLDAVLRPLCKDFGFSISYDTRMDTNNKLVLICHVSHVAGHVETRELPMPIDNNQYRTAGQNVASTVTSGRRALLELQFNIVKKDQDKDFADVEFLGDNQQKDLEIQVRDAGMNVDKFLVYMRVGTFADILKSDWEKAQTVIRAAIADKAKK